jgi:hypothetical protein
VTYHLPVTDAPHGPAGGGHDLTAQTERWVAAGLISPEQAEAIRGFEAERAAPRSTLLAEVLAYLGGALVVAAVATVVASRWEDIAVGGRLAVLGVATAIGVAGGAVARARPGPAFDRVTSVLWVAAVAGLGGFTAVAVGGEGLDVAEDTIGPLISSVAAALAIGLYALHRRALQLLAVGVSTTALVVSVVAGYGDENTTLMGIVLMALGVAWLAQSFRPVLPPYWMGFLLGGLVAWIGSTVLADDLPVVGLGLGALGAAGLLALSVRTRDLLQLGVGALGLFVTLPRLAIEVFGSSVGGPLALLVVGVLVLVVALMAGRVGRDRRHAEAG